MLIRNLIYHVTPLEKPKDVWLWNIEKLKENIHIFNGKRIVAVAQGPGMAPLKEVQRVLPGVTLLPLPNDLEIRESASLPFLLSMVKSGDPNEVTFYGHTKGVTRTDDKSVRLWTQMLYHHNLDRLEEVDASLKKSPCTGSFLRQWTGKNFPKGSTWHYQGTFFWFRNKDLFERKWNVVPKHRYGAENPNNLQNLGQHNQLTSLLLTLLLTVL